MDSKPTSTTASSEVRRQTIEQYMVTLENIITFKPDQPIQDVIATVISKRIAGAPVLDDQRHLVGIISEKDCLRLIVDQASHNMPAETRRVADYMTPRVQTLSRDTSVLDAAKAFLNSPIRRFPIMENDRLIGQVSRRHILCAALEIMNAAKN